MNQVKKYIYGSVNDGQDFISLLHFLYLQPYNSVRPITQGFADGFITNEGKLYIWMPTPPEKDDEQQNYIAKSRKNIAKLLANNYDELILDLRNNIGGNFFTFYNTLLPFFRLKVSATLHQILMFGEDLQGNLSNVFFEHNGIIGIKFTNGYVMKNDVYPLKSVSKPLNKVAILVNERTMSSSEIMCILFLENFPGAKLYGNDTGGLTNGCNLNKIDGAEIKVPIFTFKSSSVENNTSNNLNLLHNYKGKIKAEANNLNIFMRK